MACIISLIDPTTNNVVKTHKTNGTYPEAEKTKEELNQQLNKKSNPKEKYWTVTAINI